MDNELTKHAAGIHVYVAMGLALWAATFGAYAMSATASIWTWVVTIGALILAAGVGLRARVANDLGAHSRRDDASRPSNAPPATFARRLSRVDVGVVVLASGVAGLVVALMVGALQH